MNGGIPVVNLFGIEFRVSFTLAVMVGFVALIGAEQSASLAPDMAVALQWLIGAGVAALFLVSVVAHELAHALVGRRRGVRTTAVVLGLVGGMAPLSIEASAPRDEFAIAVAGPIASLAIAAAVVPVGLLVGLAGEAAGAVTGALFVLAALNVMLGVASLLPGLPLDGGRVVRAVAWARTGDRDRAAMATARSGRALGWGVIGVGVVVMVLDDPVLGLMLAALGWLLAGASRGLEQRAEFERAVRGLTVAEALVADVQHVSPGLTVDTFASQLGGDGMPVAVPVVDDGRVLGVVGATMLRRLPRRKQSTTRAADVMAVPPQAPLVAPGDQIWTVLEAMQRRGLDGLAVVEEGRLVGMVTRESAAAVVRARLPLVDQRRGRGR
jgi:Zn-dependent protease/CBS domain-containing protein